MRERTSDSETGGAARRRILEVARELFMKRGYRAVTTREIADEVGVTQPALYHHFGGKEELYTAVLERELASLSRDMRDVFAREELSVLQRFEHVATQLARNSDHDMTQMTHDLRREVSEHTQRRVGKAFFDAMVTPLVDVLAEMEAQGEIAPARKLGFSPHERAFYVLGVVRVLSEGQQRGHLPEADRRTSEMIGEQAARLILHGLAPPRGH